ncbi:hypothetical protein BOVMAS28_11530 [Streptococcus uberis]
MLIEKIEKLSKEKGWTLYRLAKEADITLSLIYTLKNSKSKTVTFETMVKIADVLDVSLDEFR